MIRFLVTLAFFFSLYSCKKVQEKVEENRAMDFITKGQWKVANLSKSGTDYTSGFASYIFQFTSDGKVKALNNGAATATGSWEGNLTTAIIKANFPANAVQPLPLLNGTWQITDGSTSYTVASKTENGETSFLRLEKL